MPWQATGLIFKYSLKKKNANAKSSRVSQTSAVLPHLNLWTMLTGSEMGYLHKLSEAILKAKSQTFDNVEMSVKLDY